VQGYNGTVLAYGQTGSGKTHTMSGGVGHYGVKERGVTPRVIDHVFAHVANIKRRLKPGESIHITACAVEIYNEEFRDLSKTRGREVAGTGWDSGKGFKHELKLQVRPCDAG
jgi:Kinesin motor domain